MKKKKNDQGVGFVSFSPNCNNFYFESDALHDWFHYI